MDLYCVKCKTRTSTNDVTTVTTKNNRSALSGRCATCAIKKFRFISTKSKILQSGDVFKKNEEVISQPNWQSSLEPHGQSTPEKSTFRDIATVDREPDLISDSMIKISPDPVKNQ